MKKIRVLEIIDKPFLGGGQKAVLLLAAGLDKKRFEVSVCSEAGGPMVEELGRLRVRHHAVEFNKRNWLRTLRVLRGVLRREAPDIVHTHGGIAGFFGRWAAQRSRTPVIIHTLHGIHYLHYRNPVLRWIYIHLEKDFSRFTDRLVFVSEADRAQGRRHRLAPDGKMAVVKNGLEFKRIWAKRDLARLKKRLGLELQGTGPVIGTVARLHRQKGLVHLIEAADRVRREFPGMRVLCLGGGPLERRLKKAVQRRGLADTVLLLGEKTDVQEFISLFDVFVLPSLWEGLPFALIEAAALGRPIVATDIDGIREVVTDGETGLLVRAADSRALAEAVLRLLRDKKEARMLGLKAQLLIPPQFIVERMIEATEKLYLEAYQSKAV